MDAVNKPHPFLLTQPISRVMSLNDHLSRPIVTNRFKRPTRERDGQPHSSLFGLASSGVYRACLVTKTAVSSYLAFPPLPVKLAVYFCCTSLGVASTGCYPAPCPMKPGLSSPATFRFCSRDHLSESGLIVSHNANFIKHFLDTKQYVLASLSSDRLHDTVLMNMY